MTKLCIFLFPSKLFFAPWNQPVFSWVSSWVSAQHSPHLSARLLPDRTCTASGTGIPDGAPCRGTASSAPYPPALPTHRPSMAGRYGHTACSRIWLATCNACTVPYHLKYCCQHIRCILNAETELSTLENNGASTCPTSACRGWRRRSSGARYASAGCGRRPCG